MRYTENTLNPLHINVWLKSMLTVNLHMLMYVLCIKICQMCHLCLNKATLVMKQTNWPQQSAV